MQNFNKLKILFVCKWFPNKFDPFQGYFIYQHAKALALHHLVSVISVSPNPNLTSKFAEYEISDHQNLFIINAYYRNKFKYLPLIKHLLKIILYYHCLFKAYRIIKRKNNIPNLVHINVLTRTILLAWYLKIFYSIKYIITEHWTGYMPIDGRYRGFFKKKLTELAVKYSSAITTVSNSLKNNMLAHKLKGNYYIVENIIETPMKIKQNCTHKKIKAVNISDFFDEMKNISGIIKCLPQVTKAIPNFELHIIGKGIDEDLLIKLTKDLQLYNRVVFFYKPMPHHQLLEFLSNSSFVVVNSRFETFSVVAAEALACGIPVIATQCGGPEEFITPNNGMLLQVDNSQELINTIITMSNKINTFVPETISKDILSRFSEQNIADKFNQVYLRVLNN